MIFLSKQKQRKKRTDGSGFRLCLICIVAVIAAALISKHFYQLMLIRGGSMEPSYHDMQLVFLEKNYGAISAGDVIAFRCEGLDFVLVKRVVALPGQTVVIREGTLYVDGKVSPCYVEEVFDYAGLLAQEVKLPTGNYAVIGDNVIESKDSRYEEVGFVPKGNVSGRVSCGKKFFTDIPHF